MTGRAILLVGQTPFLSDRLRQALTAATRCVVCCVAEAHDAIDLLRGGGFGLVVVYLESADDLEEVDVVQWSVSQSPRPCPVVAVAATYDEEQALRLFRMGIADYLSMSDHRDRLPTLLAVLAGTCRVLTTNSEHSRSHAIGAGSLDRSVK
jgi:DNA-binding NarL/FixJ family response regulator